MIRHVRADSEIPASCPRPVAAAVLSVVRSRPALVHTARHVTVVRAAVRPITLPDRDRHRAEGAGRSAGAAGQRDDRAARHALERRTSRLVSDAAIYAPNTYFTEFTARKLSNPRFRGIGSSPANPADHDLHRRRAAAERQLVEHRVPRRQPGRVRARAAERALRPQHARRPHQHQQRPAVADQMDRPGGSCRSATSRRSTCARTPSGPIGQKVALGFAFGHSQRDGFTVNDITGHDLDSRDATFGKAQLLLDADRQLGSAPDRAAASARATATTRLAIWRRCARNPFHVVARLRRAHQPRRDVDDHPRQARRVAACRSRRRPASSAGRPTISTDLDYTPLPLVTRSNGEKDFQFTQEVRVASAPAAPVKLSDTAHAEVAGRRLPLHAELRPGRGQHLRAVRAVAAPARSPVDQHSPEAALDDGGFGVYGQGTVTLRQQDRRHRRRARRPREQEGQPQHLLRAAALFRRRSSTPRSRSRTSRRSLRSAITSRLDAMVYVTARPRLQGGRLQSGVAARERAVRRGAHLARRGRPEEPVGRTRDGQRRGVLDRLERSAAERAEPVRARAVLHRQRRRRRAAAASRSR